ncbi:MAG: hypothetical protein WBO11_12005, partial [Nitrospira sp.]
LSWRSRDGVLEPSFCIGTVADSMPADNVAAFTGEVRKFTCLGTWQAVSCAHYFAGVGRYGTADGGRNGANYLIDFNPAMVTR